MKSTILAVVVVLAAVAAGALLWADRQDTEAELAEPVPAVRSGQPTKVAVQDSFSGTLTVQTGRSVQVKAPSWNGLITAVHLAPGDTLGDGTDVVSIDGIVRRAAVTEFPFHRALTSNDRGADVEQLHELLVRWGHLAEMPSSPDRFRYRTTVAVRSLAAELGGDSRTRFFDPSWLIWLPSGEEFVIARLGLAVGEAAPGLAATIIESDFGIVGYSLESEGTSARLDGSWLLVVLDDGIRGHELTAQDGVITDDALTGLLEAADGAETIDLGAEGSYSFTIDGDSTVDREVLSVPATSLRGSIDGTTLCVFVRNGDAEPWTALAVTPEDAPGASVVIAGMPELADREVLFNPAAVLEDPYCP